MWNDIQQFRTFIPMGMGGFGYGCIHPDAYRLYFDLRRVPNKYRLELLRQVQLIDLEWQIYQNDLITKRQKKNV